MKKYYLIAKLTWQEYFTYRLNFWLEVLGNILTMLIIILIWYFIYVQNNQNSLGGYTLSQMITYLIGTGLINSFILLAAQGDEIDDDINLGKLSNQLVKPLNPTLWWLTRDFCRRLLTLLFGAGAFILIYVFFHGYILIPHNLIFIFISIGLAALLHFNLFYLAALTSFWTQRSWGIRFFVRRLLELASGALIPITFFPGIFEKIALILPFRFFSWFPMQIYLQKISPAEITGNLLQIIGWLGLLFLINYLVLKKGLRKYASEGI